MSATEDAFVCAMWGMNGAAAHTFPQAPSPTMTSFFRMSPIALRDAGAARVRE